MPFPDDSVFTQVNVKINKGATQLESTQNATRVDKKETKRLKNLSVLRQVHQGTKRCATETISDLRYGSHKFPVLTGIKKQKTIEKDLLIPLLPTINPKKLNSNVDNKSKPIVKDDIDKLTLDLNGVHMESNLSETKKKVVKNVTVKPMLKQKEAKMDLNLSERRKKSKKEIVNGMVKSTSHQIQETMEPRIQEPIDPKICENFNKNIDLVLSKSQNSEDVNIDHQILIKLYEGAAGLNYLGTTNKIHVERLVKLLNLLQLCIKTGMQIPILSNMDVKSFKPAMERVLATADACLINMYIQTSKNMPKRIYLEEVIDQVMLYMKHHISNTVLPASDPTYSPENKSKCSFTKTKHVFEKSLLLLGVKMTELIYLLADLVDILTLQETSVFLAFSIGSSTFWAKNVPDIQKASLKLVTKIFTKYKIHKKIFLDSILSSFMLVPGTKQNLRTYTLKNGKSVSIVTVLIIQLIQSMVNLPEDLFQTSTRTKTKQKVDIDTVISTKYQEATFTGAAFVTMFFHKCHEKQNNKHHNPLFESFVHDLLVIRTCPEFPGTDLVLCLLGKILVKIFLNKDDKLPLRMAGMDCLTIIAAKLRKDNVFLKSQMANIEHMLSELKQREQTSTKGILANKEVQGETLGNDDRFLQRLLLEFIAANLQQNDVYKSAKIFFLVQWYKDLATKNSKLVVPNKENNKTPSRNQKNKNGSKGKKDKSNKGKETMVEENTETVTHVAEHQKFLLEKIQECLSPEVQDQVFDTVLDYNSANMIVSLLASKRYFSQSFDQYFNAILMALKDASTVVRTKALKCLTAIIETDPTVLESNDAHLGISQSFIDPSTSVREAAVDLLSTFILDRPELIHKYYDILSARILDTGISVRKRVIKIFNDICLEYPDFDKNTEICAKIIRRINDEDSVKDLVLSLFQDMWFTCSVGSKLFKKVKLIVDVVVIAQETGLENFGQLLLELLNPGDKYNSKSKRVRPKDILNSYRQIVDCLMEPTLRVGNSTNCETSERFAAVLKTLHIFAKVHPHLLVRHICKLQNYLEQNHGNDIIGSVIAILELAVPLLKNPSDTFLVKLQENIMKLVLKHDRTIVNNCLACLASICNRVTHNYDPMRECFIKFYNYLVGYTNWEAAGLSNEDDELCKAVIKRSLFIVGLLLKYFDFKDPQVLGELSRDTTDQVYQTMIHFLQKDSIDIKLNALKAIGSICTRYYHFIWEEQLKTFYFKHLDSKEASFLIRTEVLTNIENFLIDEEKRLAEDDKNWSKKSKQTDLKEMDDVSSGMPSIVIQYYLKPILNCYIHHSLQMRQAVSRVVQMILHQGLVNPIQIVPYLICMSTDNHQIVALKADKYLQDLEKRYPGIIHMKSSLGVHLSFQLQTILQGQTVVRGFKIKEKEEYPVALNGHLYSLLRSSRQQRRFVILYSLKQFEEPTEHYLSYMLYLADNMAYFPYQVQDEPLFLVHYIDIKISVFGSEVLRTFQRNLISVKTPIETETSDNQTDGNAAIDTEEDDEDEETLLKRLPHDTKKLEACMSAAQGWLLLLTLKQYIVDVYGLSQEETQLYSPSAPLKTYEKPIQRKSNVNFNPKSILDKMQTVLSNKQPKRKDKNILIREYIDFNRLVNSI